MKLTDKQSLIICAIVVFGFTICGIIGILDNFVIVAVLVLLFLLVVVNLFTNELFFEKDEENLDITNTSTTPFNQDETL